MKKKFKSISAFILIISLIVNMFAVPVNADSANTSAKIVYVDGIRFVCSIDEKGTVTVKSSGKHTGTKIKIYSNGKAEADTIDKNGTLQSYDVKINELSQKDVNIDIYDEQHRKIGEYNGIESICEDSYEGQTAATAVIAVPVLGAAFKALILTIMVAVIGGITYYVGAKAIEKIKSSSKMRGRYYRAELLNGSVYIAYKNPITKSEAGRRIRRGKSVYSYTKSMAKSAVKASGWRCASLPEIDSNRKRGKIYFYHYHTNPKNGSHSWYGLPYTGYR